MTLKIRNFKGAVDLKHYRSWFTAHGWASYPVDELLSDTGLMVVDECGTRVAACFVYYTNSKIVLMEWLATNPDQHSRVRIQAVDKIVDYLKALIESQKGLRFLMGATDHEGLRRHYLRKHKAISDQKAFVVMWDSERGRYKHGT